MDFIVDSIGVGLVAIGIAVLMLIRFAWNNPGPAGSVGKSLFGFFKK